MFCRKGRRPSRAEGTQASPARHPGYPRPSAPGSKSGACAARAKFIDIDGKRFVWRELLQRRREQLAAAARVEQPVLFELKEDCRPIPERTAAGRYSEPSLFASIE